MKFKTDFFRPYLNKAPLPLAIERNFECEILSRQVFTHPILDIGCGEGLFANILFDEKIDVGIDPNTKELERAAYYGQYEKLINCFGNKIDFQDAHFETIFSNSVLEHIPDIEAVLRETHRLIADDGNIYFTVPTNYFDKYSIIYQFLSTLKFNKLAERYRLFFNGFWKHYHYHSVEKWIELFEKNDFRVMDYKEYGSRKICVLNDLLAPFCLLSFISKKIANRWYISSYSRKISAAIFYFLFRKINFYKNTKTGGIVFFSLRKAKL